MKHLLAFILILTCLWAKSQELSESDVGRGYKPALAPKLGIPFGTVAKIEAEIFYGETLRRMAYQDIYLLKIKSVNGKMLNKTLLLRFEDETKSLANDEFALYELLYKKKPASLERKQINKMNEKYVGKKLTLMAYETGYFRGIPHNYPKDGRPMQDFGFCFEHYLEIISNLKK